MQGGPRIGRQSLVTPIDWKLLQLPHMRPQKLDSRQSLVTPIDWKPTRRHCSRFSHCGRQSLVTPIDWKPPAGVLHAHRMAGRQSLVTPIDWKPVFLAESIHDGASPILGDAY